MSYSYTSHTTYSDGSTHYSSVVVRELDEGEVGILLAGNHSIFDPSLTPHMLEVPSEYNISDVDSISDTDDMQDEAMDDVGDGDDGDYWVDEDENALEEHWFPSLLHRSIIEGLDDDNDNEIKWPDTKNTVTSSLIIEKEDTPLTDSDWRPRRKKSRSRYYDQDDTAKLVPIEVIYLLY
ncbi:hypothetical protein BC940DRAFT_295148 [Gongronella butleri]|nr:hypothetical protein BC940DRAFT_295148 [Gongronella butleri]